MNAFEGLVSGKGSGTPVDELTPISGEAAKRIESQFPGVPRDYLSFLLEVGYGVLGDGGYMIYSGLLEPDEVYGDSCEVRGVLLFGDDYQGYNAGFEVKSGSVIEVDPTDMSIDEVAPDFTTFILNKVEALR